MFAARARVWQFACNSRFFDPRATDVHISLRVTEPMNSGIDQFLNLPEMAHFVRVVLRLVAAALLGGLVGAEREWVGKAAGLRTHMLVALGAAVFVLAPAEAGLGEGDIGRIIQGIAAGIGFIGAGTILKRTDRNEIKGLTTAAGVWLTAAVGVAAAVAPLWLAAASVACALVILFALGAMERKLGTASTQA
jgi:putative Mg2+ transporter-C (MgtC) family protein